MIIATAVMAYEMYNGIILGAKIADSVAGQFGTNPVTCEMCLSYPNFKFFENCSLVRDACLLLYKPHTKGMAAPAVEELDYLEYPSEWCVSNRSSVIDSPIYI